MMDSSFILIMSLNEIVFLGTGGDRFSVGRQMRSSGGIVLRISGIQFHLDPGPGSLVKAKDYGINPRETNVLLASHNGLIHCNDINVMIDAMTHSGLDKSGILLASRSIIYGDEKVKPYLTKMHRRYVERYVPLDAGHTVKFNNNIKITALKTQSNDSTGVGFKFVNDKFSVGYTSDTGYFPELAEDLKGSDVLILNIVMPFGHTSEDYLSSDDAIKLIREIRPRLAILTHFGQKMLEQDPIYQARKIQRKTNVQTIAARDGMAVDPITYVATKDRKTMNFY